MHKHVTTSAAMPAERVWRWTEAICDTYFPLDLSFYDPGNFQGSLDLWDLAGASLSRLDTDGIQYRRRGRHLRQESDDQFLITVPTRGDICFAQEGREVVCGPGAFVIERSHLPYRFQHPRPATLWILKVRGAMLRANLADPDRLASLRFDATAGAARLFTETLRLLPGCVADMNAPERGTVVRQLLELLALALDTDKDIGDSSETPVRQAHLHRIRRYVRRNLASGDLSPPGVAEACGISVRYLHQLVQASGTTLGAWIRDERLSRADAVLRDPRSSRSIAAIAYELGFADQAQLSRHYKARFGRSPRDTRAEARRSAVR